MNAQKSKASENGTFSGIDYLLVKVRNFFSFHVDGRRDIFASRDVFLVVAALKLSGNQINVMPLAA